MKDPNRMTKQILCKRSNDEDPFLDVFLEFFFFFFFFFFNN
jgi:hypothetical protein